MANFAGKRLFTAALVLLQLGVGLLLPLSHAEAEAGALSHEVHIQAAGEAVCVPHAELTCATCRMLSQHLAPLGGRQLSAGAQSDQPQTRLPASALVQSADSFHPLGSRAPPTR